MASTDDRDRDSGEGGSAMGTRVGLETSSPRRIRAGEACDDRVPVTLVCVFCSQVQMISRARETAAGDRIYWECFSCQKKDPPSYLGTEGAAPGEPEKE